MKFVHAADLHLGSVIAIPTFGKTEPALLLWHAFDRLIDACLEEEVNFLLLAGDTFDSERISQVTRRRFTVGIQRLTNAGIKVFLIHGNHDPFSDELAFLGQMEGLKVFSASAAETVELPDMGIVIHGQSFVKGPINQNLALAYPKPVPDFYNIGMLHTSLTVDGEHARYAPCSVQDLIDKNYDYWALGHVHTAQVFQEKPWIGFCGNLQGRHIREGGGKGANLVLVDGGQTKVRALELSSMEFVRQAISIDEGDSFETAVAKCTIAIDAVNDVIGAFRLELSGSPKSVGQLLDRQNELEEAVGLESALIQSGLAVLIDVKLKLVKQEENLILPFELSTTLDDGLFKDVNKALVGKGISTAEVDEEELEAFVSAGLSNGSTQLPGKA